MRCREVLRKLLRQVLRKCLSTAKVSRKYRATRNQIQEQKLDRSTRCREAIEEAGAFSIDPPGIEDEEAPERKRFRAGVDLRLGAIDTTNVNRNRGRKRKYNQKSPKQHQ